MCQGRYRYQHQCEIARATVQAKVRMIPGHCFCSKTRTPLSGHKLHQHRRTSQSVTHRALSAGSSTDDPTGVLIRLAWGSCPRGCIIVCIDQNIVWTHAVLGTDYFVGTSYQPPYPVPYLPHSPGRVVLRHHGTRAPWIRSTVSTVLTPYGVQAVQPSPTAPIG